MGDLLNSDKVQDSFYAVASFLESAKMEKITRNEFVCNFKVLHPTPQRFQDKIEFECRDCLNNPSYIINSDSFKGLGYHRPVWSSYSLFSWDENTKELSVNLNDKTFIIKHQ